MQLTGRVIGRTTNSVSVRHVRAKGHAVGDQLAAVNQIVCNSPRILPRYALDTHARGTRRPVAASITWWLAGRFERSFAGGGARRTYLLQRSIGLVR